VCGQLDPKNKTCDIKEQSVFCDECMTNLDDFVVVTDFKLQVRFDKIGETQIIDSLDSDLCLWFAKKAVNGIRFGNN
jgi:hypothetical protein